MPSTSPWSAERLEDWLTERIAVLTGVPAADVDPEAPFASLRLDSVDAVELVVALEDLLGCEIESTIAWDYPTIRLLSAHVAALAPGGAAAPSIAQGE
jgi:acyl carrier protein